MSAHFAKCSYLSQNIFRLSPESWSFISFSSPSLSSSSLPTRLRSCALKTTLYKSRSMLSIDGRLVLKFHSRQNLFSKIPWHLLKTRHLVRNSSDRQLFQKIFRIDRSQLLLDGRFGPKFHLAQTFLRRVYQPFPFFAVHYSSLQFVTAQRMLGDLRWHFVFHSPHRVLTLIQTTIRMLQCVVNNDKVCETQHPRVCAFGAQTDYLFSWRAIQPACTINQFWGSVCVVQHNWRWCDC